MKKLRAGLVAAVVVAIGCGMIAPAQTSFAGILQFRGSLTGDPDGPTISPGLIYVQFGFGAIALWVPTKSFAVTPTTDRNAGTFVRPTQND
jgi:hypothetical protein